MKKLIAISVVFVLLTAAAFAQPSVGGNLAAKITLIASDSQEKAPLVGGISFENSHVNVDYANGDGTAGGRVRLSGRSSQIGWWGGLPFAFGWWRPIPQLRVQIGHNPDGDFGAAQITGWGFNAEAQNSVAIDQDSGDSGANGWKAARRAGFYGGYSELGATLSLYPVDGLTVNLILPFGDGRAEGHSKGVGTIYPKFHLNIVYSIPDIGVVRVTFVGKGGLGDNEDYPQKTSVGDIFASFFLNAIDDLGVDLGIAYGLGYKDAADLEVNPTGLSIGLGLRYVSGDFGIKFRAGTQLARVTANAAGTDVVNSDTTIGVVILPYYTLPALRVYLNAGFGISLPDGDDPYNRVDWFVNPYITKSVSSFTFYAGFKLWSDGAPDADTDAVIKWAVPIGFNSYF